MVTATSMLSRLFVVIFISGAVRAGVDGLRGMETFVNGGPEHGYSALAGLTLSPDYPQSGIGEFHRDIDNNMALARVPTTIGDRYRFKGLDCAYQNELVRPNEDGELIMYSWGELRENGREVECMKMPYQGFSNFGLHSQFFLYDNDVDGAFKPSGTQIIRGVTCQCYHSDNRPGGSETLCYAKDSGGVSQPFEFFKDQGETWLYYDFYHIRADPDFKPGLFDVPEVCRDT